MGPEFSLKMAVQSLSSQQIVRIHQLFRQAKFDDPSGDVSCLPAHSFCSISIICVFVSILNQHSGTYSHLIC